MAMQDDQEETCHLVIHDAQGKTDLLLEESSRRRGMCELNAQDFLCELREQEMSDLSSQQPDVP
jgi:hypothetical protein